MFINKNKTHFIEGPKRKFVQKSIPLTECLFVACAGKILAIKPFWQFGTNLSFFIVEQQFFCHWAEVRNFNNFDIWFPIFVNK